MVTTMSRRACRMAAAGAVIALLGAPAAANQNRPGGWRIPPAAESETNPLPETKDVLEKGQQVYASKCRRCHGPQGKGDGPDADPDHRPGDLSDPARAARNPDGVIFYKVWNGRRNPRMPAFSAQLERQDVWAVVHYVKRLRTSQPSNE